MVADSTGPSSWKRIRSERTQVRGKYTDRIGSFDSHSVCRDENSTRSRSGARRS
jgi:hypothetical protein